MTRHFCFIIQFDNMYSVAFDTCAKTYDKNRLYVRSSAKLHTLLQAMSPAILRIGGSPADWLFFNKPLSVLQAAGLRPNVTVATSMYLMAVSYSLYFMPE